MTIGEFLNLGFGWLAQFIDFVISFVPRIKVLAWNERGVKFTRGGRPTEVGPGVTWYWPWCTKIVCHFVVRCSLQLEPLSIETKDGVPAAVGLVVVYRITDVVAFEAENFNADDNMAEVALACLRNVVMEHSWAELKADAADGSRLEGKLTRRMGKTLEQFGVTVESCRPTDQVRLGHTIKVFGMARLANNDQGL